MEAGVLAGSWYWMGRNSSRTKVVVVNENSDSARGDATQREEKCERRDGRIRRTREPVASAHGSGRLARLWEPTFVRVDRGALIKKI